MALPSSVTGGLLTNLYQNFTIAVLHDGIESYLGGVGFPQTSSVILW